MTRLGSTIGRIRLIELAGKGGMGEVFVGYDETLGRKVAVKCVSQDYRLNRRVAGRILREARILSRLAHPNICQIYDLKQEDDGDFLILELVEGRDLKEAMEQGLDFKTKLHIAQQIVDVLVAAHSEGVIHRDLKPDNIMLTDSGDVKVLDFGIARSLGINPPPDHAAQGNVPGPPMTAGGTLIETRTHGDNLMGTPRYMSPEQVRAEAVTPASDMFSFGLILQELLTEKSPYQRRQPLPSLLLEVAAGHSRPVEGQDHVLTRLINELKSLAPSQRPTAKEASRRLRWIRRRPVRRLRRAVAAGIVLLIIAVASKYTLDLKREQRAALQARNQAEDLVAFMLEDLAQELEPVGRLDILGQVAYKALEHFEGTPDLDGETVHLRGQAFHNVAQVLDYQGDLDAALEATDAALRIQLEASTRDFGHVEKRVAVARTHLLRGNILSQMGDTAAAEVAIIEGMRLAKQGLEKNPDETPLQEALAEAQYSYGLFLLFTDTDRSDPYFLRGIELYEELARQHPERDLYRYRLAVLHGQGLSQVYKTRGLLDEELKAIRIAYAIYEDLLDGDVFNSKWLHGFAWENRRLGEYYRSRQQWTEALAAFDEARRLTQQLLTFEPAQPSWQLGLGADHFSTARVHRQQGKLAQAVASYEQGLQLSRRLLEFEPNNAEYIYWQAMGLVGLGASLEDLGQTDEAHIAWRRAARLTARYADDLDATDLFVLEYHILALLHLQQLEEVRPLVEHLRNEGWFEATADDDLIALCRRHGLEIGRTPSDEPASTTGVPTAP